MRTPFYDTHKSLGAKIVDFHGWEMPLQYSGIVDEHINVRTNAGLFDVSHMGRFEIKGSDSFACLQKLITNDLGKLADCQALYSPMCYEDGGIVDDIIACRLSHDHFLVVVNASNRSNDFDWIVKHSQSAAVENVSDKAIARVEFELTFTRNRNGLGTDDHPNYGVSMRYGFFRTRTLPPSPTRLG